MLFEWYKLASDVVCYVSFKFFYFINKKKIVFVASHARKSNVYYSIAYDLTALRTIVSLQLTIVGHRCFSICRFLSSELLRRLSRCSSLRRSVGSGSHATSQSGAIARPRRYYTL